MTPKELLEYLSEEEREILARCEKATPGPWEYDDDWIDQPYDQGSRPVAAVCDYADEDSVVVSGPANGDFLAHARTDVPALLQKLAEARAALAKAAIERLSLLSQLDDAQEGKK